MERIEAGPLKVRCVGPKNGPAVLLCHGYGAPGDDLCALARSIDAGVGTRWYFPEALEALPLSFGIGGRQWWPIDMVALQQAMLRGNGRVIDPDSMPDGLLRAHDALGQCIAHLIAHDGLIPSRTVLGGFSQGAMLTTDFVLTSSDNWAGLMVLSGTLLASDRWRAGLRAKNSPVEVFQSHGRVDPVLPFASAEALRTTLSTEGATVTWAPFNGPHAIPETVLTRAGAWLRERFG